MMTLWQQFAPLNCEKHITVIPISLSSVLAINTFATVLLTESDKPKNPLMLLTPAMVFVNLC
jgi:hypothetical protein